MTRPTANPDPIPIEVMKKRAALPIPMNWITTASPTFRRSEACRRARSRTCDGIYDGIMTLGGVFTRPIRKTCLVRGY
jgi:hypothetical protein